MKEGWLHEMGFDDYAFGTMVHALSGIVPFFSKDEIGQIFTLFNEDYYVIKVPHLWLLLI